MESLEIFEETFRAVWDYLNHEFFHFAGIFFSYWDIFVASLVIVMLGLFLRNLIDLKNGD